MKPCLSLGKYANNAQLQFALSYQLAMPLPLKKKRRLEGFHLPDEILDRALSFLSSEDVLLGARCVNVRFAGIALNYLKRAAMQTDPLSIEIFNSLAADKKQCFLDPAALWKNLLVARDGSRKMSVMRENHDYHNVINAGGVPPFFYGNGGRDNWPHWMESLNSFRFAVRLWTKGCDGKLSSVMVEIPEKHVFLDDFETLLVLERGMGELSGEATAGIARQLQHEDYYALEILVCSITMRATNKTSEPTWATLYSSIYPLVPYGGGDYEEYQAMPFFVDDHDDENEDDDNNGDNNNNNNDHTENWATLPFCEVDFVARGHGQSLISLRFHWRTRQGLDYQDFSEILGTLNCLVLWKHRCSPAYGAKDDDAHLSTPKCQLAPFDGLVKYIPKPLEMYSFRIDIQKEQFDLSAKHSIFFERLPEESSADQKSSELHFEIPTNHHHNHFPWAEDYKRTNNTVKLAEFDEHPIDRMVEFDEDFFVYIIDRRTGKQAKLFQSGAAKTREEHPDLEFHPFLGFEKSAALTQYSVGDVSPNIPVPTIWARMHGARKKEHDEGWTRRLDLSLSFLCFSQGSGGFANAKVEGSSKTDLLAFLEKGLTYH